MRVLFDVGHPAQVHFFKNVIRLSQRRGHDVLVTSRRKDVTTDLLDALGIEHTCLSEMRPGRWNMASELRARNHRLWLVARQFKPDVMVARVGVAAGPVGRLLRVPTVIYDDMEHARLQAAIGLTFATYICTGLGYYRDFGRRQVRFAGPPVLAYLHPDYFVPDPQVLRRAGLHPEERIIFIRTVSWGATHDRGRTGLGRQQLTHLVEALSHWGRVIVSSEAPLPPELKHCENPVPVAGIHHLLAFATLCLVEGGTMAAEAAVLGTPTICLQSYNFGYLIALERDYQALCRTASIDETIKRACELLQRTDLRPEWARKRDRLLADSEDVVAFQMRMIERAAAEHPKKRTAPPDRRMERMNVLRPRRHVHAGERT